MSDVAQNALLLSELQAELFRVELKHWFRRVVTPALLVGIGAAFAVGAVPLLLMSLAWYLSETTELAQTSSLLVAGLAGAFVAGLATGLGIRGLRKSVHVLNRSADELKQNIYWIKQVLKHRSNPRDAQCGPAAQRDLK